MSMSEPYRWGGSGPSDCSGDMAKRARQYADGMSIEDILQSIVDDYAQVLERLEARDCHTD